MIKGIDDFFDDAETEIVPFSNFLARVTFRSKISPYKTFSKFELTHFFCTWIEFSKTCAIYLHQWDQYQTS
jgi:hypothetical protein